MTQIAVTSRNARFLYYDIESLANVFTCVVWDPRTRFVEAYVAISPDCELARAMPAERLISEEFRVELGHALRAGNPTLAQDTWDLKVRDLNTWDGMAWLAVRMGLSDAKDVCDPTSKSGFGPDFRLVCDTDTGYDPLEAHPYLAGYNSKNYDTTMISCLFAEAFGGLPALVAAGKRGNDLKDGFTPVDPATMRRHNDALFTEEFKPMMPAYLRQLSLVSGRSGWDSTANRIYASMHRCGRHIDIAAFNEVQKKVAFKRLLGGEGRQIKESDRLSHNTELTTVEELMELLTYNAADSLGLPQLFANPVYSSAFDLKKGLLDQYPETIYDKRADVYAPDMRPHRVRRDRLAPDSTSAKFVARILAPYSSMVDYEAVSFMYPAPEVAAELDITPKDVLEEARSFFYESVQDADARAAFDEVYTYYDSIRGRNFNDSEEYSQAWSRPMSVQMLPGGATQPHAGSDDGLPEHLVPIELRNTVAMFKQAHGHYPKLSLPYFQADGTPSTCFVTFSTGGIHGSEADRESWLADCAAWDAQQAMIEAARAAFPDARELVLEARRQHGRITLPDGTTVDKTNVLLGSDPAKVSWRKPKKGEDERNEQIARAQAQVPEAADLLAMARPKGRELDLVLPEGTFIDGKKVLATTSATSAQYRQGPTGKRPELFEYAKSGTHKLKSKYTYTSMGMVIHEDFTSYYPNMLRNMRAFFNAELGEDRYAAILAEKDRLGKAMKAPGLDAAERERLSVMRSGTKLILNSASGAGDTTFANQPIRVNNKIISMRLIGQLFSWMIGQAQTLAGARIVSTNTDGLYSTLDPETNNAVLEQMQARINVEIEPEPLVLVSKDSNNRVELLPDFRGGQDFNVPVERWEDINASGASMTCHKGPRPDKSLAHPAIRDWALARYLRAVAAGHVPEHRDTPLSLNEELDAIVGKQLLAQALELEPVYAARLFQNMIAASNSKITIPFAADPLDPENPDYSTSAITNPRNIQHYNRVFYVKAGTPGAVSLRAAGAWAISKAVEASRARNGVQKVENSPASVMALRLLRKEGYTLQRSEALEHGLTMLPLDQDVTIRKIPGIDPAWSCLILNEDLHAMDPGRLRQLLENLDMDVYELLLAEEFGKNWMNATDQEVAEAAEQDEGAAEQDETEDEAA